MTDWWSPSIDRLTGNRSTRRSRALLTASHGGLPQHHHEFSVGAGPRARPNCQGQPEGAPKTYRIAGLQPGVRF